MLRGHAGCNCHRTDPAQVLAPERRPGRAVETAVGGGRGAGLRVRRRDGGRHGHGIGRDTIAAGLRELEYRESHPDEPVTERLRRGGAGRKRLTESDPTLLAALEALVEPLTRGDPMSPLRWTCKSTRRLATELTGQGHRVGYRTVAWLLHEAGYSLQANRKTREGDQHPDRNAQFEFINAQAMRFQKRRQPVISVDTKKKELVGDFKNGGREWHPRANRNRSASTTSWTRSWARRSRTASTT